MLQHRVRLSRTSHSVLVEEVDSVESKISIHGDLCEDLHVNFPGLITDFRSGGTEAAEIDHVEKKSYSDY